MRKPVYKVVKKRTRTSCVVPRCKYQLKYEKGKVVKAREGTLGVFCFKRKMDALHFQKYRDKIIKVKPIGRGIKVTFVSNPEGNIPKTFDLYYNNLFCRSVYSPRGTVCYPAVEVLE